MSLSIRSSYFSASETFFFYRAKGQRAPSLVKGIFIEVTGLKSAILNTILSVSFVITTFDRSNYP